MYNIKNNLLKVIELATDYHKKYEQNDPEYREIRKILETYLNNLDFEIIKAIQVIMYLGRDEDYLENESPVERYVNYRLYSNSQGWNKKDIEIVQMTEKLPLADYLKRGMEILGIK